MGEVPEPRPPATEPPHARSQPGKQAVAPASAISEARRPVAGVAREAEVPEWAVARYCHC